MYTAHCSSLDVDHIHYQAEMIYLGLKEAISHRDYFAFRRNFIDLLDMINDDEISIEMVSYIVRDEDEHIWADTVICDVLF